MNACGSCGAQVIWARTVTGRRMPVNAEPAPDGNVTLIPASAPDLPLAVVGHDRDPAGTRHTSHFATCPHASQHRRTR